MASAAAPILDKLRQRGGAKRIDVEQGGALAEIGYRLSLEPVWPRRIEHQIHLIGVEITRLLNRFIGRGGGEAGGAKGGGWQVRRGGLGHGFAFRGVEESD